LQIFETRPTSTREAASPVRSCVDAAVTLALRLVFCSASSEPASESDFLLYKGVVLVKLTHSIPRPRRRCASRRALTAC